MSAQSLVFGFCILIGAMYFLYRLGIWIERRHSERCYICAGEIDLMVRDWKREGHYWDSSENRWAHLPCRMVQIEQQGRSGRKPNG